MDWQDGLSDTIRALETDVTLHPLDVSNRARTLLTIIRSHEQRLRHLALRLDVEHGVAVGGGGVRLK
jgi:hypothetical protein